MFVKPALPSLEQAICNHLQDIDYLSLSTQKIVIEDEARKTFPIHHRNFLLTSKVTVNKQNVYISPPKSKGVKRSNSMRKTFNAINQKIPCSQNDSHNNQQIHQKIDQKEETKCESESSEKSKTNIRTSTYRKTLSRFLFEFDVPTNKNSPQKKLKTLTIPGQKIHTLERNYHLKNRIKSQSTLRKTYISQPLNIDHIILNVQSQKIKSVPNELLCLKRPNTSSLKQFNKRIVTQPSDGWELKPWIVRNSKVEF